MPRIKLTKTAVDAASPQQRDYELRDTTVPGFMLKVTPTGRKIFMVQYRTNSGERRKPAIGRFGELTVEQARWIAQDWLADVRRGKDPSAAKAAARNAPAVRDLCKRFIEDYSQPRNKPSTVETNQQYIDNHIVPMLGSMKVNDVTRADVAKLMKRLEKKPVGANRVLACARCSTWPKSGGIGQTAQIPAAMSRNIRRTAARPASSQMKSSCRCSLIWIEPTLKVWNIHS